MSVKKIFIAVAIIAVAGAGIAANVWWKETDAPEVQVEAAVYRDLTATVTGSGAIQPAREVDISSNVMGRVTRLAVEEGDEVLAGDFLLQVDPQRLESAVAQMEASLQAAKTQVELAQQDLEYQQELLDRREGLYRQDLLSRELYLEAQQNVTRAQRTLEMRQQEVQRIQAQVDQSRYDLTQVVFDAPMDGIITKLNIEEGENVVTGTMNNPGTVLLTIADLSVVELEIEVDETDIVYVELGQEAVVRIDAFPDDEFHAVVTEVGKSPISTAANQAINFKVVVTLTETVPGARPGLSGTADITTATREHALSVPIQALILREVKLDEDGEIIREVNPLDSDDIAAALEPEQQEAETVEKEGAFVVRDGRALFTPIRIGIAGERHFEVLDGVEEGDQIIIGPFEVIRTLLDGEAVTVQEEEDSGAGERTVNEG
ncbi:MAG: efflux RND transporter periplasmic adaptor subunit [Acidobacteriota bacterium]|jgi:HlyD family secretion protein